MTEQKHKPEPWKVSKKANRFICTETGEVIAMCDDLQFGNQNEANARRIVACVNACAGIRTEALERRVHMLQAGDDEIASLRQQRDQLRAALVGMVGMYTAMVNSGDCGNWNPEEDAEVIAARAALAATE